jgi:hypothetical protein
MPQRFLRPGIRNSERWNSVNWQCQAFYVRLLTLVDDFGRYDGRPAVLWGDCFSIWNEKNPSNTVQIADVRSMLQQLAASPAQLIDTYEADGKQVLQITQWVERIREGSKERWPKNPNPQQVAASRSNLLPPPPPPSSPPAPSISSSGEELPVELPVRFPKTESEAIKLVSTQPIPADFVKTTWNQAMSRAGKDAKGLEIASFLHYVIAQWKYKQEDTAKNANRSRGNQANQSRNIGTLNEGKESEYANVGKIRKLAV